MNYLNLILLIKFLSVSCDTSLMDEENEQRHIPQISLKNFLENPSKYSQSSKPYVDSNNNNINNDFVDDLKKNINILKENLKTLIDMQTNFTNNFTQNKENDYNPSSRTFDIVPRIRPTPSTIQPQPNQIDSEQKSLK